MNIQEKYEKRFSELVQKGNAIIQKYGWTGQEWPHKFPSDDEYNEWYASAANLIAKVCGESGIHYNQIHDLYTKNSGNSYHMAACMGVLKAAFEDFKLDMLDDTRALITAEVFTDFIEQAEYLLGEHYKLPAAVLTRAVLEDGLRSLCGKNGIILSERPKLEVMNVALCKAGVYNITVKKQITAWADIGNHAAHCRESEFSEDDVRNMINGVISFNATFIR